ncbi:MAG TPA: FecR family protein [Pyrinomonadaceae bacterium]|jgi:hypothetical protein|nr:FecR family protein [Pyrinomonadaceae bacterium]
MKKILGHTLRVLIAMSFVSACAAAQTQNSRDARLISARAGGVNFVEGEVSVRLAGQRDWQRLSAKDDLRSGDTVRTGPDGRVEVLLNPGSYFRAGEGTEFTVTDDSLDKLQLDIVRGSAVVEAVGYNDLNLSININTPKGGVRLVRTGVYRFNVQPSGETEVAVFKGRALVGEGDPALVVKAGNVVHLGAGGTLIAKLDKNDRDALDNWSRDRGKELAKLNNGLAGKQTNTVFSQTSFNNLFASNYGYGGVWAWSYGLDCFTFLPFGFGWASPYGYGYNSFWPGGYGACGCGWPYARDRYDGPRPYYPRPHGGNNPPHTGGTSAGNNGSVATSGSRSNGTSPPVNAPSSPSAAPSFPSYSQPVRDVPSRGDVDRPMPERTREPGTRP